MAAAGLLGALALVPPGQPLPWDRVLVVTVGWFAGWLWSGSTVWPEVFRILSYGDEPRWGDFLSGRFVQLTAGGALSGIVGVGRQPLLDDFPSKRGREHDLRLVRSHDGRGRGL